MIVKMIMTVIAASKKKATVVTLAVRKITMCVKRKKVMKVMLTIMKIITLDCQVHIKIDIIIPKENLIIST